MLSEQAIVTIVVAVIGMIGVILGSGGGLWAYLAMRRKSGLNLQVQMMEAEQRGVKSMLDSMRLTIEALRGRLDVANTEYDAQQTRHSKEMRDLRIEHDQEVRELHASLESMQQQFEECKTELQNKISELTLLIAAANAKAQRDINAVIQ